MPKIRFGRYGIVVYSDWPVRAGFGGITYGPFVFIRPRYVDDRGLLEHELVHTRQFWNPRKWFWSKLQREVEAYREQIRWYPDDRTAYFARVISTKYGIDVTYEAALALLRGARA